MRAKGAEGRGKGQHLEPPTWLFKKFGIYFEDISVSLQDLNRNNMMRFVCVCFKWLLKSILCKEISTFPMIWNWSRTVFS